MKRPPQANPPAIASGATKVVIEKKTEELPDRKLYSTHAFGAAFVEVEVDGLGRLSNHVVTGPTPIRTDVGAQPTESEEVISTAKGGDWEFRGQRRPVSTPKDVLPFPRIRPKFQS